MNYLLSFFCAACIAIMLVPNGNLTQHYDVYIASFIIHLIGLMAITIIMLLRKEKFRFPKSSSIFLCTGGIIGVGTTMFNNAAYGKISISAILALGLLAQAVTSLVIDHYGYFHMPVQKFNKGKLIGFIFTMLGIICLLKDSGFILIPVILSLLTGITVVTSRCVNAELAEKTSVWTSTWYNFMTGLVTCGVIWVIAVFFKESTFKIELEPNVWMYSGALIGVTAVTLLNIITKKMSAFILTLIMFVGQLFTGLVIDLLQGQSFTMTYILGGILTMFGLCFNLWMDHKRKHSFVTMKYESTDYNE